MWKMSKFMHTCWALTLCQHWAGGTLHCHERIFQWYLILCLSSIEGERLWLSSGYPTNSSHWILHNRAYWLPHLVCSSGWLSHLLHGTLIHPVTQANRNQKLASNYSFIPTPYQLVHQIWCFFSNVCIHYVSIPYSLSQAFIISCSY